MRQTDCLLCHVVSGTLRARRVAESDRAIAIMNDAEPFSRGHVVVFPKSHVPRLDSLDDADLVAALLLVKRVAAALPVGQYNVLQNNGALAGQTVFHVHFHVIPKWSEGEGLIYGRPPTSGVDHGDWYRQLRERLRQDES